MARMRTGKIDLTCSICTDAFKKPKVLPCGHTFCLRPCLVDLMRQLHSTNRFSCPLCRSIIKVRDGNPECFPDNYVLTSVIDQLKEKEKSESIFKMCCKHCLPMDHYCVQCSRPICSACRESDHNHGETPSWTEFLPRKVQDCESFIASLTDLCVKQQNFRGETIKSFGKGVKNTVNMINIRRTFMKNAIDKHANLIIQQISGEFDHIVKSFHADQVKILKRITQTKRMAEDARNMLKSGKFPEPWVEKDIRTTVEELREISTSSQHSDENPFLKLEGNVVIKENFQEEFVEYVKEGNSTDKDNPTDHLKPVGTEAAGPSGSSNQPKKGPKCKGNQKTVPIKPVAGTVSPNVVLVIDSPNQNGPSKPGAESVDQEDSQPGSTLASPSENPKDMEEKTRCPNGSSKDARNEQRENINHELIEVNDESDFPSISDIKDVMRGILKSKDTEAEKLSIMLSSVHADLKVVYPRYAEKVSYSELRKLWQDVGREMLKPIKSEPVSSDPSTSFTPTQTPSSPSYTRRPLYRSASQPERSYCRSTPPQTVNECFTIYDNLMSPLNPEATPNGGGSLKRSLSHDHCKGVHAKVPRMVSFSDQEPEIISSPQGELTVAQVDSIGLNRIKTERDTPGERSETVEEDENADETTNVSATEPNI